MNGALLCKTTILMGWHRQSNKSLFYVYEHYSLHLYHVVTPTVVSLYHVLTIQAGPDDTGGSSNLEDVVEKLNAKPLISWVKACELKPSHTAETNRQILSKQFTLVSENRQQLPPLVIENITKKLNDNAVCEELDKIGLTRPRTAKARKTLLQSYLIENFTSVNMLDRREDFKLEKSRIKGKKKKARSNTGKSFLDTKNPTSVEKICEAIVNTGYQPPIEEGHQSVKSGDSPVVAAEVANDGTNDLSDEIKYIPKTTREPDSSDKTPTDEAQKKSKKGKKNVAIRNLGPAAIENVNATTAAPISGYEKPLKTLEDGLLKLQETATSHEVLLNTLHQRQESDLNASPNVNPEIRELKQKVNSLLEALKIQQETLNELVEHRNQRVELPSPQDQACPEQMAIESTVSQTSLELRSPTPDSEHVEGYKCKDCDSKFAQIFCFLAVLWQQNKTLRKSSWQTHLQESYIKHDHAYCKPRQEKPKKKLVKVVEEEIDDNPGEIVIGEAEVNLEFTEVIFNEEEIEVSELTEIFDQKKSPEHLSRAIPIIKTSTLTALPLRSRVNSTCPKKNKCIILHDCPNIIVNEKKLTPFFDIECIQVNSLRTITSRKNLNNICNTIMDTKPEAIFIHLGYTDLRRRADVDALVKNYDRLLHELERVTDANICATMLKQTHGYVELNYSIKHFNNDIKCLINKRRTTTNGSTQVFIEEEQFVIEGIGSKSEVIEESAYMIPPEDEVEMQSIPIPSIPGSSARFGNNHNQQSGDPSKHNNSTRDHKPTSSNYCSDRTKKLQNIKVLGSHDTRLSCETAPSPLGTKRPRKPSDKEEDREEATTSTAIDTNGQCRQHEPYLDKEKTPEIDQAENTGDSIPTPRGRSYPTRRSNQKCLLVHDDFFNEFDETKFSGRFEISTYRAFSVDDIISKGGLVSKVRNTKPDIVFVHTGFQDLFWHKLSADDLFGKYKQMVYNILESTTAKLCLSAIIPIPGFPRLTEEIESFNGLLSIFVNNLRSGQKYRNRVFTSCNRNLGGFINKGTGKNGVELFLSERGQRKIWLMFRDSLYRALDMKTGYGNYEDENGYKPKRNRND